MKPLSVGAIPSKLSRRYPDFECRVDEQPAVDHILKCCTLGEEVLDFQQLLIITIIPIPAVDRILH